MDKLFTQGGSNRTIIARNYITAMMYKYLHGAVNLEDVNQLHSHEAFQEVPKEMELPTSYAVGYLPEFTTSVI